MCTLKEGGFFNVYTKHVTRGVVSEKLWLGAFEIIERNAPSGAIVRRLMSGHN